MGLFEGKLDIGLLRIFARPDINAGVKKFRQTPGAVLLDVRTPAEYRSGHVPQSQNYPLGELENAPEQFAEQFPEKARPLFVYCRSGARSGLAEELLKKMGYTQVEDIGGIIKYTDILENF